MSQPHICPVCNGTGKVSTPPHVAGDRESYLSAGAAAPFECPACKGRCVLWCPEEPHRPYNPFAGMKMMAEDSRYLTQELEALAANARTSNI